MGQIADQNKIESETSAYKMFMRVAKKLRFLDYGKWAIVPDKHDPLRKFTVEKNIGWATVKLMLYTQQYHKRNWSGSYDASCGYRYRIGVQGLLGDLQKGDQVVKTGLEVKPRMARKLLAFVNDILTPKFYSEIENTRLEFEERIITNRIFINNMRKLQGMITMTPHRYNSDAYTATPPNDPTISWPGVKTSDISLHKDFVNMSLELTYDKAKKILEALRG